MGLSEFLGYFFPYYYYDSVSEIPFEEFWKAGYRGIIFDVDKTLTGHHETEIHQKAQQGLESSVNLGFSICALTNCTQERGEKVRVFLEPWGIEVIVPERMKPSGRAFEQAETYLDGQGVSKDKTFMVGDHILTDIIGANRYDITSVLVNPTSKFSVQYFEVLIYRALHRFLSWLIPCNQSF